MSTLKSKPERDRIEESTADGTPALSVEGLRKTYADGDVLAVDGISLDIEHGSVVGLLGPNGAGKTTAIKSMLGTVVPDDGDVEMHGVPVHENAQWVYDNVGVMFEGSRDAYWRLTVRENLEFFTRLNGVRAASRRDRHDELLERLNLMEKADEPVRKLSRGMKQKVALASTLAQDIEMAFLDEPTLGLDVQTRLTLQEEIRSLVENRDLTVLVTSHDMGVIEDICDRVIVLSNGRIIADDSIGNLKSGFRENTYRFRLADLSGTALEQLHTTYDIDEHSQYGSVHEFEITLPTDDMHSLSTVLHELDCTVRSFETVTPELEEIFLEITNSGGDSA